jgi:hypothetical protein
MGLNNRRWLSLILITAGIVLLAIGLLAFFNASIVQLGPLPITATFRLAVSTPTAPAPTLPQPQPTVVSPLPTLTLLPAANSNAPLVFNGDSAYQHVLAQVAIGPRPTGSEAGWATGDYILAELEKAGWPAEAQEFLFKGVKGRNIIGKKGQGPIIILGAHYDTRPAANKDPDPAKQGEWIEGANDGASGVAVLLELARTLEADTLANEVWLAFFDAEDRGNLGGWPFSVGARHMAQNLKVNPQGVVVIDMIGDADQQIFYERYSNPVLSQEIWAVAAQLGYQAYLIPQPKHTIIDDHIPFLERGIPAIDMIDFDYPYWHTTADTADKVAPASLERVGRTLEVWLEKK